MFTTTTCRGLLAAAVALALACPWHSALAQAWPTKPVNIVVPFPAGGGTDAFARPLFAAMAKNSGKQFIIDNKGGAGGTLGAGSALQDLIAGQVDMLFDGLGSWAVHIKNGRIKALAVASAQRAPGFPDAPTSAEAGVATWYGLWAPKGTPQTAVDAMTAEVVKGRGAKMD